MQRTKFEQLFYLARGGGSLEDIQSLINFGVDLNGKDSHGRTPILLAAQWARRDIVELLIEQGADIHCCNEHQFTVLHYAAMKGWSGIVQYLVEKGVDINSKDCHGMLNVMDSGYPCQEYKFMWRIHNFTRLSNDIYGPHFNPIPGKEATFHLQLTGQPTNGHSRFHLYLKNMCLSKECQNEDGCMWVSSDAKLSGKSKNILKEQYTGGRIYEGCLTSLMEIVINAGFKKDIRSALNLEDDDLVIKGSLFFTDEHPKMVKSTHNFISELLTDFQSLYKNGISCDVTFFVGGSSLGAHKAVLCGRSSVFANMFQIDMQEKKSNEIVIEDVEPHVFDQFLLFLYIGELENQNWDTVFSLYPVAHRYDVIKAF